MQKRPVGQPPPIRPAPGAHPPVAPPCERRLDWGTGFHDEGGTRAGRRLQRLVTSARGPPPGASALALSTAMLPAVLHRHVGPRTEALSPTTCTKENPPPAEPSDETEALSGQQRNCNLMEDLEPEALG